MRQHNGVLFQQWLRFVYRFRRYDNACLSVRETLRIIAEREILTSFKDRLEFVGA